MLFRFIRCSMTIISYRTTTTSSTVELCKEYGRRMKAHLARSEPQQAVNLLDELIAKHKIQPIYINYLLVMQAINATKKRTDADRIYALIQQDRSLREETRVQTALVYMYAVALCDISQAEKIAFEMAPSFHIGALSALMTGYLRNDMPKKTIELFEKIENDDRMIQDAFSYNAMLTACTKLRHFTRGKEIVRQILSSTNPLLLQDPILITSMINLLGKCGDEIELCIKLFNMIKVNQRSSYLYNAMLKAYNEADMPRETCQLFDQILNENSHSHDPVHFILVFNACAKLGRVCLDKAHTLYQFMLAKSPEYARHVRCRNAAIDMFGKCADTMTARKIFETNSDLNDIVSWGAMLNTYALHADGDEVLHLFECMQKETSIKPNAQIYSTVLNACSHSGLLEKATNVFARVHVELPELWKYVTMVDALARSNQFDKALELIDEYELTNSPSTTMYMSILSCARNRGLVKPAEEIIQRLENLKIQRLDTLKTAYVLLANLYNAQGRQEDAFKIRQMMREKKLIKVPGLTWVDIGGVTHEFRANDRRHVQTHEIYEEIARIDDELKQDGHIVDINSVPPKSVHSEKLAIALAFISTPPESPIVLTKNLRVCPDCHEIIKRLSRLRKREFVIRDSFRYHIFNNGQCSCGDFL